VTPEQQRLNQISQTVIGLSYKVANALGRGFLECEYENALAHELTKQRLHVKQQDRLIVKYEDGMFPRTGWEESDWNRSSEQGQLRRIIVGQP